MNLSLRLNGDWAGEGVAASPASWQLHVQGMRATLARFNEDQPQASTRFECALADTPATFAFGEPCDEFIGIVLDDSHIVIAGLDDGHDVIFSRPGLAELTAHETLASAINPRTHMRFALTRWAAV